MGNGGEERGKGRRSGGERVDIASPPPTFRLVYATPLLQHQDQFGLNPALLQT